MNIESLLSKVRSFEDLVITSGFRRDLPDFINSINQPQNRTVLYLKEISNRVIEYFNTFQNNALPEDLITLLRDSKPFTGVAVIDELDVLNSDAEISADGYYQKLENILSRVNARLNENIDEIDEIKLFLVRYSNQEISLSEGEQAVMSIIFKDLHSTGSLKEFARVLHRWNRTLLIYHTLLKSNSPEEISLVEIQNGSIDVVFNIDFDVALDLTELITVGLKAYGAYLLYKSKLARELIASYAGNKKLLKMEQEREVLLLDNVQEAISNKALEQHKRNLQTDKNIDKTGVDQKIKEISSVVTDHIVKGNEVKLLSQAIITDPENEEEEIDLGSDLKTSTAYVKDQFKRLDLKDQQLLIEKYSIKSDENDLTS